MATLLLLLLLVTVTLCGSWQVHGTARSTAVG
jgi:hypothetical protein